VQKAVTRRHSRWPSIRLADGMTRLIAANIRIACRRASHRFA
jgi:hypothetical protein